jgi:hypothetical protein
MESVCGWLMRELPGARLVVLYNRDDLASRNIVLILDRAGGPEDLKRIDDSIGPQAELGGGGVLGV